jgi:hypothetical protein
LIDGSTPLDAHFDVETVQGSTTVLFHSRGGNPVRNSQYNEGLELLLRRLAGMGAVIDAAVVDSAETRRAGLSEDARLLDPGSGRSYPLRLDAHSDFHDLRLALGRSQAAVGRAPGATGSGNYTKRIRLDLTLPDPTSAELARLLAFGWRLLVVALPHSARRNLEWGLDNGVWGFAVPRFAATEARRVADYRALGRGDHILLLSGYSGGGPRAPADRWASSSSGEPHRFEDCYLCTVNEPYYLDRTPFWPDESPGSPSRYRTGSASTRSRSARSHWRPAPTSPPM